MKPAIHDVSARQHTGGPSPGPGRGGNRNDRARKPGLSGIEAEIAGLLDRSTHELRHLWHKWLRREPPLGLSRDLLIRALAYDLQKRTHGGPSAALRRRMRRLEIDLEKGALSGDAGVVTKTGTTLLRAWRGQIHTVLVQKDGFEYRASAIVR